MALAHSRCPGLSLSPPLPSLRTGWISRAFPPLEEWGEGGGAVSQDRQAWPQAVDLTPHRGLLRATPGDLDGLGLKPHSPWALRKAQLLLNLLHLISGNWGREH